MPNWYPRESGIQLAASCTVRRNLSQLPFPYADADRAPDRQAYDILHEALRAEDDFSKMIGISPDGLSNLHRCLLSFNHLAGMSFLQSRGTGRYLLLAPDGMSLYRINDRNHLTLVSFSLCPQLPNLVLDHERQLNRLEAHGLKFARHPYFGYLCSQAAHCGNGYTFNIYLNIPGIILTDYHKHLANAAAELGFTISYDVTKDSFVSYIACLSANGHPNETAVDTSLRLLRFASHIETHELDARNQLLENPKRLICQDKIIRALTTLSNALLLTSKEIINGLSLLLLGSEIGLLENFGSCSDHLLRPLLATTFCQREIDTVIHHGNLPTTLQVTRAKILHSMLRRRLTATPEELPLLH